LSRGSRRAGVVLFPIIENLHVAFRATL